MIKAYHFRRIWISNVDLNCCIIIKVSTPIPDHLIAWIFLRCSRRASSVSVVIFHDRTDAERSSRAACKRNCVVESCVCVWGFRCVSICAALMPFNVAAEESEHQSLVIYDINHAFGSFLPPCLQQNVRANTNTPKIKWVRWQPEAICPTWTLLSTPHTWILNHLVDSHSSGTFYPAAGLIFIPSSPLPSRTDMFNW